MLDRSRGASPLNLVELSVSARKLVQRHVMEQISNVYEVDEGERGKVPWGPKGPLQRNEVVELSTHQQPKRAPNVTFIACPSCFI